MEAEASLRQSAFWRQICFGANPTKTLIRVGIWASTIILFFHYLLLPIQIVGTSMSPTYSSGSMNFINKLSYIRHPPERGDIVALATTDELLLKRIVALPGERVRIRHGELEVNGKPIQDQFSGAPIPSRFNSILLGPNEFFVIGDNRERSVFLPAEQEPNPGQDRFLTRLSPWRRH